MSNPSKGTFQPNSDVYITYEDQQKINKFANLNAKVEDLKDELKVKQNDLKNLEEASDEISLLDENDTTPILIGEVFVSRTICETLKFLENAKEKKITEISDLEKQSEEIKAQMGELKYHLYGKFGSYINLECEEE